MGGGILGGGIIGGGIMGNSFAHAAEAQQTIPNLSGYWARPEAPTLRVFQQPDAGPGPITNSDDTVVFKIGDFNNPILLSHAAQAVQTHGDYGRAGQVRYEPWALCLPIGVPHVFLGLHTSSARHFCISIALCCRILLSYLRFLAWFPVLALCVCHVKETAFRTHQTFILPWNLQGILGRLLSGCASWLSV